MVFKQNGVIMERKTIVEKCIKVNKEIFELDRDELYVVYIALKQYHNSFGHYTKEFTNLYDSLIEIFQK